MILDECFLKAGALGRQKKYIHTQGITKYPKQISIQIWTVCCFRIGVCIGISQDKKKNAWVNIGKGKGRKGRNKGTVGNCIFPCGWVAQSRVHLW